MVRRIISTIYTEGDYVSKKWKKLNRQYNINRMQQREKFYPDCRHVIHKYI